MTTTIYETPDESVLVTQYVGPASDAFNGDRRRIQLTLPNEFVQMSRQEFIDWLKEILRRLES